eukprot:SAG22_NODE_117_length_19289_cov_12.242574_2_plen_134_part_00
MVLAVARRLDGPLVEVRESRGRRGRGVFAAAAISIGEVVEVAPCIGVPGPQYASHVKHSIFEEYLFHCRQTGEYLLALGIGSLFNHNEYPNVDYRVDGERRLVEYKCCKPIGVGEELCIFYGDTLWFNPTETQ